MNGIVFFLYKLAGGIAVPPGCFFALLFALLLWGLLRTRERFARRILKALFCVVVVLYALFMPVTAEFLMGRLEVPRQALPDDGVPTLVAVLAGGGTHPVPGASDELELAEQSYQRLAEGVRVANLRGWPLVYSGAYDEGDPKAYEASLRLSVEQRGLKGEFILEANSRTTWENLGEIAKIAEARGFKRVVLSTTAYHMKRSLWMAARRMPGTDLVAWPSGWRSTRDRLMVNAFGPSARAFYDSCTALREIAGLAAYRFFN